MNGTLPCVGNPNVCQSVCNETLKMCASPKTTSKKKQFYYFFFKKKINEGEWLNLLILNFVAGCQDQNIDWCLSAQMCDGMGTEFCFFFFPNLL